MVYIHDNKSLGKMSKQQQKRADYKFKTAISKNSRRPLEILKLTKHQTVLRLSAESSVHVLHVLAKYISNLRGPSAKSCPFWASSRCDGWDCLMEAFHTYAADFGLRQITKSFWALGSLKKLGVSLPNSVTDSLQQRALVLINDFDPRAISGAIWAMARLDSDEIILDTELVSALQSAAIKAVDMFNQQDLANTMWGLATLFISRDDDTRTSKILNSNRKLILNVPLVAALNSRIKTCASYVFKLVNVTWARAKLLNKNMDNIDGMSTTNDDVSVTLFDQIKLQMKHFSARDVSTIFWSLSTLRMKLPLQVSSALFSHAFKCATQMNVQDISNILWAIGRLGVTISVDLSKALQSRFLRLCALTNATFLTRHVAQLASGLTKLPLLQENMIREVEKLIIRFSEKLSGFACCSILRSFANISTDNLEKQNIAIIQKCSMKHICKRVIYLCSFINSNSNDESCEVFSAPQFATICWSFASLEDSLSNGDGNIDDDLNISSVHRESLFVTLSKTVKQFIPRMDGCDASNTLWAFAKLFDESEEKKFDNEVSFMLSENILSLLSCSKIDSKTDSKIESMIFRPMQLVQIMWSLVRLDVISSAKRNCHKNVLKLVQLLITKIDNFLTEIEPRAIANVAWTLASSGMKRSECKRLSKHISRYFLKTDRLAKLDWKSLARLDFWIRSNSGPKANSRKTIKLKEKLKKYSDTAISQVERKCTEELEIPFNLFLDNIVNKTKGTTTESFALPSAPASILLVNDFKKVIGKKLKSMGYKVKYWNRFCCKTKKGSAWVPKYSRPFDACCMRLPIGTEGFRMALDSVASVVKPNAKLFVFGRQRKYLTVPQMAIEKGPVKKYYDTKTLFLSKCHQFCLIGSKRVNEISDCNLIQSTLNNWRQSCVLSLPITNEPKNKNVSSSLQQSLAKSIPNSSISMNWISFPGLFAGGGLDVMTAQLLGRIPKPLDDSRILDFCSGSGSIAASLLSMTPSIKIDLLEADTVALEAAKENVPRAYNLFLSDCWNGIPSSIDGVYDCIISNPPVHIYEANSFGVVIKLVSGAAQRMKSGGKIWIVAQEVVPVGQIIEIYGQSQFNNITVFTRSGRFCVWVATKCVVKAKKRVLEKSVLITSHIGRKKIKVV